MSEIVGLKMLQVGNYKKNKFIMMMFVVGAKLVAKRWMFNKTEQIPGWSRFEKSVRASSTLLPLPIHDDKMMKMIFG